MGFRHTSSADRAWCTRRRSLVPLLGNPWGRQSSWRRQFPPSPQRHRLRPFRQSRQYHPGWCYFRRRSRPIQNPARMQQSVFSWFPVLYSATNKRTVSYGELGAGDAFWRALAASNNSLRYRWMRRTSSSPLTDSGNAAKARSSNAMASRNIPRR
jgi:hypothetical protein